MMSVLSSQHTILVIEDNAADADLVADAFGGAPSDPRLVVATGGRAALALLRDDVQQLAVDVILLDLNLPVFTGVETLAELNADPALRRIPVIVLTTSKSQDEIDRCYDLGAAAVLNKPMRLRDYREMLCAFERFWLGQVRLPRRG